MAYNPPRESDGTITKYAWPGGYAVAYITGDGAMLCPDCVQNETDCIHFDENTPANNQDGWNVVGHMTADWHDIESGDWICDHCNAVIDPEPEV